ncbi:hypothetical protein CR203_07175 [Salipaludibacillus neizhouensis]|uniref:DUF2254 domain-containing protein n=1 Tax=Salipaludibacillus neizhouensis TaxID=885475 RepID=A0A3A9K6R0_9BACI|nr:DUF2254 domain-containing protein [Salipaludibacillus neizhouensis]RKL68257.1 hypothetical protein CR203_07175 [Salipaludibacillus neizhouensis]
MSLSALLLKMKSSFWCIPLVYAIFAIILALVSLKVDVIMMNHTDINDLIPQILLTDIDLARLILSSISASLLTMTTITFSMILVVLTTFLSEFSPRTLQNFITNTSTQQVLGVFVGGFVYSILVLLFLKESEIATHFFVPVFAVFLAIVCLMVFVFFIHHTSNWIQVSNLIHNITLGVMKKIDTQLLNEKEFHKDAPWEDWESEEIKHMTPLKIHANKAGYIRNIHINKLVKQAEKDDCIIRLERLVGEYVNPDISILSVWATTNKSFEKYEKYFSISTKLASVENIEFDITKIVEIALRALSPSMNDPYTAINCINNLGRILNKLGSKHLPESFHHDRNKNLRVIWAKPDFTHYLNRSFYQIVRNSFSDISVLIAVIKALTLVAENNSKPIKEKVWELGMYINEGVSKESLLSLDRRYINKDLESLAKATNHSESFKPH